MRNATPSLLAFLLMWTVACGGSGLSPTPASDAGSTDAAAALVDGLGDAGGDTHGCGAGTAFCNSACGICLLAGALCHKDSCGNGNAGELCGGARCGAGTHCEAGICRAATDAAGCVESCKQTSAPNYGGFELYEYAACKACPSCASYAPCESNVSPPAGTTCVACLQGQLTNGGLTDECKNNSGCASFALCLASCP